MREIARFRHVLLQDEKERKAECSQEYFALDRHFGEQPIEHSFKSKVQSNLLNNYKHNKDSHGNHPSTKDPCSFIRIAHFPQHPPKSSYTHRIYPNILHVSRK